MYSSYGGVSSGLQSFVGTWLLTYFLKSILPQRHKMSLFFQHFSYHFVWMGVLCACMLVYCVCELPVETRKGVGAGNQT